MTKREAAKRAGPEAEAREAEIAARVRDACVQAAIDGWEHASISGLCGEGAFECAVGRIRALDPARIAGNTGHDG